MTNFWEHGSEGEIRHGKNMVDAAKKMGVRHFIYSTLDGIEPHVPHWTSKAEVDGTSSLTHEFEIPWMCLDLQLGIWIVGMERCAHTCPGGEILMVDYLKESGVPRTSLYTAFYIENFLAPAMAPKKQEDGSYLLPLPTLPDGNPSKVSKIPPNKPQPKFSPPMTLLLLKSSPSTRS